MKVRLVAHEVELAPELKEYVTRRVHFSLGRFTGKIKSVSVRLADSKGPRGDLGRCCDIRVDAGLSQEVVVCERQDTIRAAVALAMERVERAMKRHLRLAHPPATPTRTLLIPGAIGPGSGD